MSNRSIGLDDRLYEYLLAVSLREPEILRQLREETAALPQGMMQISRNRASSWPCWSN